jgi:hypothetical protein
LAGLVSNSILGESAENIGLEGVLALPFRDMLSYKGVLVLIGLGLALVLTMLALMTVDTLFSKTVAERVGTAIVMGFGILFYFTVAFDPGTTATYVAINPFYWIYHAFLSMIDLSFGYMDIIYLALTATLLIGLTVLATKSIEREKVLFT